mmetsp:Transcript_2004/g.6652  ORF Transcript_2004/g.6652 Transcript_2004/m.6652 type:complete len:322 (-) Transcript_2004:56-1021(-)
MCGRDGGETVLRGTSGLISATGPCDHSWVIRPDIGVPISVDFLAWGQGLSFRNVLRFYSINNIVGSSDDDEWERLVGTWRQPFGTTRLLLSGANLAGFRISLKAMSSSSSISIAYTASDASELASFGFTSIVIATLIGCAVICLTIIVAALCGRRFYLRDRGLAQVFNPPTLDLLATRQRARERQRAWTSHQHEKNRKRHSRSTEGLLTGSAPPRSKSSWDVSQSCRRVCGRASRRASPAEAARLRRHGNATTARSASSHSRSRTCCARCRAHTSSTSAASTAGSQPKPIARGSAHSARGPSSRRRRATAPSPRPGRRDTV